MNKEHTTLRSRVWYHERLDTMNTEVEQYILSERSRGASDASILTQLEQSGWKRKQIEKYFSNSELHGLKKLFVKKSVAISLSVCFALAILSVFVYRMFKPAIEVRGPEPSAFIPPTISVNKAKRVDIDHIQKFIDAIVQSDNLEFTERSETRIGDICVGKGEVLGIIEGGNQYLKSDGQFTPETYQSCPIDLKEAFVETYWIGEKIYYRQYKDRNFTEKRAGESVSVGSEPKKYLRGILPSLDSLQLIEKDNPSNSIEIVGFNGLNVRTNYIIYLDDSEKIKRIDYHTDVASDPELGNYSSNGTFLFSSPQQQLVPPP